MMSISIFPYRLIPVEKALHNERAGALLRVKTDDGIGYADVHPWPELGDAPLKEQLEYLKNGKRSPLISQSLKCAKIDAKARSEGKHLLDKLNIPKSHLFVGTLASLQEKLKRRSIPVGTTIKIKLGANLEQEITQLTSLKSDISDSQCKFVIDFNERLTEEQFEYFLDKCEWINAFTEFFEDPIPYHPPTWMKLQHMHSISLGCDRQSQKALNQSESCRYIILKPAVQDLEQITAPSQKLVVTSYLDHPIGQLNAAYTAAFLYAKFPEQFALCGLITHDIYEKNSFSTVLSVTHGSLIPEVKGSGLGYNDILEDLIWTPL